MRHMCGVLSVIVSSDSHSADDPLARISSRALAVAPVVQRLPNNRHQELIQYVYMMTIETITMTIGPSDHETTIPSDWLPSKGPNDD